MEDPFKNHVVYLYVVIRKYKDKNPEVLCGPCVAYAKNEKEVILQASKDLAREHFDNLRDVEVIVRPF